MGTECNLKCLCKRVARRVFTAEGNVMMGTEEQREIYEDAAKKTEFEDEEEPMSQAMQEI